MTERIDFHIADRVAHIGINRPEKKNALTLALYVSLVEAFERAEADPSVRVLLLHGSNECFTAGNDLQDFLNVALNDAASPTARFLRTIHHARKPIVAGVAGPAIGIGTTMLLHCDLIYADPNSRFQLPFVNLGLCPEAGSSLLLHRLIGHPRAAELLLLGEPFNAATALELGLINGLSPPGEVLSIAEAKARQMAERPLAPLLLTKSLMKNPHERQVDETISEELEHFAQRLKSPEAVEAFQAFFARRNPDFSKFE